MSLTSLTSLTTTTSFFVVTIPEDEEEKAIAVDTFSVISA